MSQADIDIVKQSPMTVRQLWLETLSMTQKGMLVTKLRKVVKDVVREYFPSRGGLPRPSYAKAEGLAPSTTILDRTLQYLFSLELVVIETHFSSGGKILTETSNIRHLFAIRFESRVLQRTKALFTMSTMLLCMSLSPTSVVSIRKTHS